MIGSLKASINSIGKHNFKSFSLFFGVVIFFLTSFLSGSTFLNENLFVKQYGSEFTICIFSLAVFGFALYRRALPIIRLTVIDFIIVFLLSLYSAQLLIGNYSLYEQSLPFYYVNLYLATRVFLQILTCFEKNILHYSFLIVVYTVLISHQLIILFQQFGLAPSWHDYFNNGSTFGNPDMLAGYIAVMLPFCYSTKENLKFVRYSILFAAILVLIYIQARTALLAVFITGSLWLTRKNRFNRIHYIYLFLILSVLLLLLIIWHPESVYGRLFVWFLSFKMILKRPLGWGVYAFERYFPEFQGSYLKDHPFVLDVISPDVVHSPFNEFLNFGVILGVPGILLFSILVTLTLYCTVKQKSRLIYPFFTLFVISLSYFPFKNPPLVILIIPLLALITGREFLLKSKFSIRLKSSFFLFLILFSLSLFCNSLLRYSNYKMWQHAVRLSEKQESLDESSAMFSNLYPKMKSSGRFLITYSNIEYRRGCKESALSLLEEAEAIFCDVELLLKSAKLYAELNLNNEAEIKFNRAIDILPFNFTAPYEKILFLRSIGEERAAYLESLRVIDMPIKGSLFADPLIIKSELKESIRYYELQNAD